MKLFINIVMKQIYLFNIVAWNYRKKKKGFSFAKRKISPAFKRTGSAERALVPVQLRITHWMKSARFTAQPLSALLITAQKSVITSNCFADINLLLFCRSRCRHRRRCSSSLLLKRQERHNKGTLTALITTYRSHNKMDAIPNRTHEEHCACIQL